MSNENELLGYGWNYDLDNIPSAITLIFRAHDPDEPEGVVSLGIKGEEPNRLVAWSYLPTDRRPILSDEAVERAQPVDPVWLKGMAIGISAAMAKDICEAVTGKRDHPKYDRIASYLYNCLTTGKASTLTAAFSPPPAPSSPVPVEAEKFTPQQHVVYDKLAKEGGGTWATYMMSDISAAWPALPAAPAHRESIDAHAFRVAHIACPDCRGTGDIGGNPSYGPCERCGGKGRIDAPTPPTGGSNG